MISPFIAVLISSQDATINIEPVGLCCSLQVSTQAHTPLALWMCVCVCMEGCAGALCTGEAHAFIIKVSWDALQHLEVLKRALLREYVGIARARKLGAAPR